MGEWLTRDLRRRSHPIGRDELPFLVGAAVLVVVAAQWNEPGTGFDLALVVVAGIALVARGLFASVPAEVAAVAVLAPVAFAVGHQGHLELSWFLVVTTTLYSAWYLGSTVRAVSIAIVSSVAIWAASRFHVDSYSPLPWIAAEAFTFALGRTLARQRTLITELETAREALAVRAVAQERQRIARELHDLSGHTLAAVLLNVTGARHVLRRDLDEAERALRDAETVGRASMDQIRATVAALRTTEGGTDAPLPDGGNLDEIVCEYRRAGLLIEASITDEVTTLRGPIAIALHRIGREALANVARHAPTNRVTFTAAIDRTAKEVRLSVRDSGRRAGATSASGRYGLVGMAERARALGGTLDAGPTDTGWSVDVAIPLTATNDEVPEW